MVKLNEELTSIILIQCLLNYLQLISMNFMYKSNLTINYDINTKIKHVVDKLRRKIAPSFYS